MKDFIIRTIRLLLPWLALVGFFCLLVVGLLIFSYFLIILALVLLVLAIFGQLRLKITRVNTPHQARKHHGRTIDHQN